MKKILFAMLTVCLLLTYVNAHEVGFKVDKAVNSNWEEAFIVNFEVGQIYPKAYLNTAVVFEAPRVNMLNPDHKYFEALVGARFDVLNAELDINTGARKDFRGGDLDFTNGVSIFWSF